MLIFSKIILYLVRFFFGGCVFSLLDGLSDRLVDAAGSTNEKYKKKIVWKKSLTEVFGGILFIYCGILYGCGCTGLLSLAGVVIYVYLGILFVIARVDWEIQVIYDRFHVAILSLVPISMAVFNKPTLTDRMLGMVIIALPMLILTLFVGQVFGGGDIKLMAASGFLLGSRSVVCGMVFAIMLSSLYAVTMLLAKKIERKDYFAFGPFLAVGLAAAVLELVTPA